MRKRKMGTGLTNLNQDLTSTARVRPCRGNAARISKRSQGPDESRFQRSLLSFDGYT